MPVVWLSVAGGTGMMVTGPMRSAYTLQSAGDRMAIALAGRAAEELVLAEAGCGSGGGIMSDLSVATQVAAELEMRLGFGDMGLPYADIDLAQAALIPGLLPSIRRLLHEAMARASAILLEHRDYLDRLTAMLLDNEVLLGKEIAAIQHVRRSKTHLSLVKEE